MQKNHEQTILVEEAPCSRETVHALTDAYQIHYVNDLRVLDLTVWEPDGLPDSLV